jgi:hypothetical protein
VAADLPRRRDQHRAQRLIGRGVLDNCLCGVAMHSPDDMLPRLVRSLEASAREIDLTFADAGRRLGEGLDLFEGLKQRLSGLSAELAGDELAQAGAALATMAEQLRRLENGLSGETTALRDLSVHSHDASQALERLIGLMRLITILARGARIEAVSVRSSEHDFGDFTNEIVALTTRAQDTIQTCARDQARLDTLLREALLAQRDFERRYGKALTSLADKLEQTLAEVAARRQKSVLLTSDAAAHSGRIAAAAGGAIVALQSGDSIRQRLEHAIAGLRLADATATGDGPGTPLDPQSRITAGQVLIRLEAAQLRAGAAALSGDADEIEAALALLADDTAGLIDLVHVLYRGDGNAATSFLHKLEAELAEASDLLGQCDRARAGVDRVTTALSGVLDACQQTVAALSGTVASIVLIGMNAGLRAARLGSGGRSLVIIAQELKVAADQVAGDAHRLAPTFLAMHAASSSLKHEDRLDAACFATLDATIRQSLDTMRQSGERLGLTLDALTDEAGGFCKVVAAARLAFSNAGAVSDVITSAGDRLDASVAGSDRPEPGVVDSVGLLLRERVWPTYTMVAERTIHLGVLQDLGIDAPAQQISADRPAQADAVEEFFF